MMIKGLRIHALLATAAVAIASTATLAADIAVVGGRADEEFWNRIKKGVDDARLVVEANGGSVNYLQLQSYDNIGPDAAQLVRTAPEARQPALIQASVEKTEPLLALLNTHLANRPYLGGDAFGMADIPLGCEMHRWWGMRTAQFEAVGVARQEIQAFPHVQRWFGQLQQRPAARGVLDIALS